MRGLSRMVEQMLEMLGVHLPPWAAPAAALVVGALLLPFILRNERSRKARKMVAELTLARGADLAARREAILQLVSGNRHGLAAVAGEALRRGRQELAAEAIARLEQAGGDPGLVSRLRRELGGDRRPMVLEAEVAAIEQLVADGLWIRAQERLVEAQQAFPDDPRLAALGEQVGQRRP